MDVSPITAKRLRLKAQGCASATLGHEFSDIATVKRLRLKAQGLPLRLPWVNEF
jgi:hypothetical protein